MILTTILPADAQPVAKRIPKKIAIHGYKWVDNYFWLREKSNPEVIQFLEAENKFTAEVMKSTTSLQEKLYTEMLGRIKQTDDEAPYRNGDYMYYSRTEEGKQYPIYCRRHDSKTTKKRSLLM